MAGRVGSVRVGPVSIFALVIILSLSVMAVLTTTMSQSSRFESQKQADYATGTYAAEVKGQEFVAQVDGILNTVSDQGGSLEHAVAMLDELLPPEASVAHLAYDRAETSLAFLTADGRLLTVTLVIDGDLNYSISEWKVTTEWYPESAGNLWSGQ